MIKNIYNYLVTIVLTSLICSCSNKNPSDTIKFVDIDKSVREKNKVEFTTLLPNYGKKFETNLILIFDNRQEKTGYSLLYKIKKGSQTLYTDTIKVYFGDSYKKPRYKTKGLYNEYVQNIGKYKSPLNGLYTIYISPLNGEHFSNALMSLGLEINYKPN